MKRRLLLTGIFLACVLVHYTTDCIAQSYLKASEQDMQWWRDAKFGLFIHWGPVSLKGTEIGWSRGGERRGRRGTGEIPVEVYDNLYKEFNPVKFNADEWVAIAKEAGMKYIVFTAKHHDGFCMFNSKYTDYSIMHTPYGQDLLKQLADACHKAGIRLGIYYSPVDFYHPDYLSERHDRYIEFMHNQVRELCSNYGRVDILWFDSLQDLHLPTFRSEKQDYDPAWVKVWDSQRLFQMIRRLQPHIIINNRCGLEGDFDTPEQKIGSYQTDRPWESCIPLCSQWAWKPDDTMKSLQGCIETLFMCACGDGNLLLNVGPMPTGEIETSQVNRLREIGAWLHKNGESIYGTRGGPFAPRHFWATTQRGKTIYVHVPSWRPFFEAGKCLVPLPKLGSTIRSASLLGGGAVEFVSTDTGTIIKLREEECDPYDTIVVLRLDSAP